jgi:hypothetical protein
MGKLLRFLLLILDLFNDYVFVSAFGLRCWRVVGRFLQAEQIVWLMQFGFSILEVAVYPSYSNFFLET